MTRLGYVGYKYSTVLIGQLKRAREVLRAPLSLSHRGVGIAKALSRAMFLIYTMAMRNCHAPTTSSRVLFTCSEPMWDEELEQFEHVRKMAAISEEIESLKAMVGATQGISAMTAMTVAKLQLSANSGSSGKSNTTSSYSDANDNELWDEEVESMELLREMAAWDAEVNKLKAVASLDPVFGSDKAMSSSDEVQILQSEADS